MIDDGARGCVGIDIVFERGRIGGVLVDEVEVFGGDAAFVVYPKAAWR